MALVNGEPVTMGDVSYALQVAHRKEDLSGAGAIDVSDYMQKVINDTLMVQEARVMGLDKTPAILNAVDRYVLRESVVRLHKEEVLQKAELTEEDIVEFYKKNFEFFTLNYIVTDSEDKAREALEKIKEGGDFEEIASEYSVRGTEEAEEEKKAETEGEDEPKETHQIVVSRSSLAKTPGIEEAVLAMKPGDVSGVIPSNEKYFVVMLVSREEPDMEKLESEHVRGKVEKDAEKAKQQMRGVEYIAELREQAASEGQLHIDEEVLSVIELKDYTKQEMDQWKDDERTVAEVYGNELTVAELVSMAKFGKAKEEILDNWISYKLVDHEALSRHYEETPELKEMVETYKKQLLKDAFIEKAIMPQIMISDGILMDYYSEHKESFASPPRYKIQQITLKTMEDAQAALQELKGGADFSWVAKNRSTDANREIGGNLGWKRKGALPVEVRDLLDSLEVGQISPIISIGSAFGIIRVQGKEEGKIPEFGEVREEVFNAYIQDRFSALVDEYAAKLREGAEIEVNDKAVRALEEQLRGSP